ncbi:hypothetical protein DFW101_0744 [Solidesulfovibrio carbinoliphilus subsp. oakridgensis]|uniref:Uncharacterized protein n=1 Tax=Solidesulfovibrio carbinoliphilus subsp. oakridgensis TaxID=694327 RepID=G7Q3X1_9BACT|nr:hypothetical protein [Solidesulfovibrio carbinoliphilus]EHJ46761.1 hypothetical protein DFW101_0744 [Solidesulfovibrio carbinoliphilus subsp. oakridgensis]
MDDLKALSLRLLERDPPAGPVMSPEDYVPGSLFSLVARLCRPDVPVDGPGLFSLCLKYCFNYVHPERLGDAVTLEEATRLAGQFVRRRGGTRSLAGQDGLRRLLLHHGFALQMLLDLPKTAHLLTALLARPVPAARERFVGLDLGAGTGILLLGQYLLARRRGHDTPDLVGIEHLPQVAGRAHALLTALGVGRVVTGDATRPAVYVDLPQDPIACVTNETLPASGRRLYKEPFPAICAALYAALGPRLAPTAFLPEAVWASDREGRSWLRLTPANGFAGGEAEKPLRLFYMRDVELAGVRMPAGQVGGPFRALVSPPWREALGRRW